MSATVEDRLIDAASKAEVDLVHNLLEEHLNLDLREAGGQALISAVLASSTLQEDKKIDQYQDIIDILLNYGVDINTRNTKVLITTGRDLSALMYGANIAQGQTALMIAANEGCVPMVEFLLMRGADTDQKDIFDQTALDLIDETQDLTDETQTEIRGMLSNKRPEIR